MRRNAGVTLIEVVVVSAIVFVVLVFVVGILLTAILMPALGKARQAARRVKDGTQIRNVTQSMSIFSLANGDLYPIPSLLDVNDATIAVPEGEGFRKDTTGNILSVLIWNGSISPELLVSPSESSPLVALLDGYEYDAPSLAANAAGAMWDPGFSGTPLADPLVTFHTPGKSNQSYATLIHFGKRREMWGSTFSTIEAILANRGPEYNGTTRPPNGRWSLKDGPTGTASNTLLIHGARTAWEGNVAYNDGHVAYQVTPDPAGSTYIAAGGATVNDNIFVDETDEIDPVATTGAGPLGPMERKNIILRPISSVAGSEDAPGMQLWID